MYRRMTIILAALAAWSGQPALAQDQSLYANEWVALWGGKRLTLVRFLADGMDCLRQKSFNPAKGEWPQVGPGGTPLQVRSDTCFSTTLTAYLREADRRFGDQISLTLPGDHGFAVFEAGDIPSALVWCRDYAAALVNRPVTETGDGQQTRFQPPTCLLSPAAD